jgi:hypothetical protein
MMPSMVNTVRILFRRSARKAILMTARYLMRQREETSNIQHRTSNIQWTMAPTPVRRSMFDVEC